MRYLPAFADLRDKPCLVVGAGAVASRRINWLLRCRAQVTVLARESEKAVRDLAASGAITLIEKAYDGEPLAPYWLIVAATNDHDVNAAVAAAAEQAMRFCNVVDSPAHCSFIMPAIIDRDPVTIAVSTAGESPVLARWIKGVIEAIIPPRIGDFARFLSSQRRAVSQRITDSTRRRHFWQQAVAGAPARHAYAGRAEDCARSFAALLEAAPTEPAAGGEAWIVGAGPGDAGLITLRGRQLLAQADVVLYDRLVNPEILEFARRDAEFICVGKRGGGKSTPQAEIDSTLVELVSAGKRVCRLKGGDPMVFARLADELAALHAAGLRYEIVPGVSAVNGCAAYAGIPLTWRGQSQSVLMSTGHARVGGEVDLGTNPAQRTVALYMAAARHASTAQQLIDIGHAADTPVAIIEHGTLPQQRISYTTLAELTSDDARSRIGSPALLIVGSVVESARGLQWFAPAEDAADSPADRSVV
jgi:uroporphyrin-III C-methyltransferase/precorrin-2 dehydrogenase/sirohydrochlorin ferrochelatase